jgi:hypothetical protein
MTGIKLNRSTGILPVGRRAVATLPQPEKATGETPVGRMAETAMPRT